MKTIIRRRVQYQTNVSTVTNIIKLAGGIFLILLVFMNLNLSKSTSYENLLGSKQKSSQLSLPSTKAVKCSEKRSYHNYDMKSQQSEDFTLLSEDDIAFDQICNGSYIEMGALDGIRYSNSFVFNHIFDWKGILIEASPSNYKNLVNNRKSEIALVNAGVCAKDDDERHVLHWVENPHYPAVGGFVEFSSPTFIKKWYSENDIKNAQVVQCKTMKNILLDIVGKNYHFDFFSLDVEGAELEVLKSIDFDQVSFGIIFAEASAHSPQKNEEMKTFLIEKGYAFLFKRNNSYWFRHPSFKEIYKVITA